MSPAAIDLIPLPPIEPPTSFGSAASSTRGDMPSFQHHLEQAGRSTNDGPSRNDDRRNDVDRQEPTSSRAAESAPSRETKPTDDKPIENKADDDDSKTDEPIVAGKTDAETQDSEDETKQDPSADVIVAAIVAPLVVEPTPEVATDVVEISAEALTDADAEKSATPDLTSVAKAAANENVDPTAVAVTKTAEETALETIAATSESTLPATSETVAVAKTPVVEVPVDAQTETANAAEAEIKPAVTTAAAPVVASVAASTPTEENVDAKADAGKKSDDVQAKSDDATTSAVTVEATAPTTDAIVEAATAVVDDRANMKTDRTDVPRGDGRTENIRTDRPHTAEHLRPAAGHEAGGNRKAAAADGTSSVSQADRVRLVERVARAVKTAEQRGGDLKIRLSPPELGSLRLQVKLSDGTLSARIEAETPEARQVLLDNLPMLRERLAEQNIRVERFDVDLFNSGNQGGGTQQSREEFDQSMFAAAQRGRATSGANAQSTGGPSAAITSNSTTRNDGRLDITV
jgi:flagellar hook-length control protein FliK